MAAVRRKLNVPRPSRTSNTDLCCNSSASTDTVQKDMCISIFTAPEEASTLLPSVAGVAAAGEELSVSMAPLLLSMRLTGSYFKRHGITRTGFKSSSNLAYSSTKHDSSIPDNRSGNRRYCSLVYALFATVIQCGNVLRYVTAFNNPRFSSIFINKLASLLMFSLSAVNHVSCFVASFNGNFDRILRSVRLDQDAAKRNRRRTLGLVKCYWSVTTAMYFFLTIGFFVNINPLSSSNTLDLYLAPFIIRCRWGHSSVSSWELG